MNHQTVSRDMMTKDFEFQEVKEALLKAGNQHETPKHPIKRVKFKITFYWE